jgi:hypothetical protein
MISKIICVAESMYYSMIVLVDITVAIVISIVLYMLINDFLTYWR